MRKTKIICTLGPSTDDAKTLAELISAGLDVARINMSHGTHDAQKLRINALRAAQKNANRPVALLLDTKGPEIRLGMFAKGKIALEQGQKFTLTSKAVLGDETRANISFKALPRDVFVGTKILIDDGLVELEVLEHDNQNIVCVVQNSGEIFDKKSINVPGMHLSMPFVSEKDIQDLRFAAEEGFDFIAASFTRSAADIGLLRETLAKFGGEKIKVIAKIENSEGVSNLDEIIAAADGIMVARGDLGVEVALEGIPVLQKRIIEKTLAAGKTVITATQMLDSMITNPRPTRAEVSDVANAIYDGTSAIMLSGETASGAHPIEALQTMANIASRTERAVDYNARFMGLRGSRTSDVTQAIARATCTAAHELGAAAIVTLTKTGRAAFMVSRYRPSALIIGVTQNELALRQMSLAWGVVPLFLQKEIPLTELWGQAAISILERGLVKKGDLVIVTAGMPLEASGNTNFLQVYKI